MTSDIASQTEAGERLHLDKRYMENPCAGRVALELADGAIPSKQAPGKAVLPGNRAVQSVALIATQALTRDILAQWLQDLGRNFNVIHHLTSGDLLDNVRRGVRYDIMVVEYEWSDTAGAGGGEMLRCIKKAQPDAIIVVVSDSENPDAIIQALGQGARGYIPTTFEPSVAMAALRLVLSGGIFAPVPPLLPRPAAKRDGQPKHPGNGIADAAPAAPPPAADGAPADAAEDLCAAAVKHLGLTLREAGILALLQRGKPNRQIAAELGISENTVIVHIRHLMRKLGATNRTQAVFRALHLLPASDRPPGDRPPAD